MTEIVTRLYVAGQARTFDSPEFLLGVALDPIARMQSRRYGRTALSASVRNEAVKEGIAFGREIDVQQARNPYYRLFVGRAMEDVKRIPVMSATRSADAVAGLSTDLLLDFLLSNKKAFTDTKKQILNGLAATEKPLSGNARLDQAAREVLTKNPWQDYRDPAILVGIVQRQLAVRVPGIAVPDEALPRIQEAIQHQKRDLQDLFRPMIDLTAAAMEGEVRLPI